jgi:hypothetical protein
MNRSLHQVSLKTHLEAPFLPLVLSFAEESVKAFGLGRIERDKVRLACEEIFIYLCKTAPPAGQALEIEVSNHLYYAKIQFLFDSLHFDPYALNLTAHITPDETGMDDLGLLIAARSVDRLYMQHGQREGSGLGLIKEKEYAEGIDDAPHHEAPLDHFTVRTPDAELLKRFARGIRHSYDTPFYPSDYRYPAKMADMVTSGDYHAVVAVGTGKQAGQIGGGVVWSAVGKGVIDFFGPYVFDKGLGDRIAVSLIDSFLGHIAKTEATFAITMYGTPQLPRDYFELLGTIDYQSSQGHTGSRPFYYRQLKEDTGCQVWAHRELEPFLRTEYSRLFLPREILTVTWEGEQRQPHSVFTPRFDRSRKTVRLRPVLDGEDAANNLADHVRLLMGEGFGDIFLEMDLGRSWQGLLVPALLQNRFVPVLLLPNAGRGDVVVFQHKQP